MTENVAAIIITIILYFTVASLTRQHLSYELYTKRQKTVLAVLWPVYLIMGLIKLWFE